MTQPDKSVSRITDETLAEYWSFYPTRASHQGLHAYDGRLSDLSATSSRHRVSQVRRALVRLETYENADLSQDKQFDLRLLRLSLENELANLQDLRWLEWDPQAYMGHLDVVPYIHRTYAPFAERAAALTRMLAQVPDFLAVAHERLRPDLPAPVLSTAIEAFSGLLSFYRRDLLEALRPLEGTPQSAAFRQAQEAAVAALGEFLGRLRERESTAVPEFALGSQNFLLMLRTGEMVDLPLDRLETIGRAALEDDLERLHEASAQVDPRATPQEIVSLLGEDRPTAASLIPDTREMLEEIRRFVIENTLASIPSEVRCDVVETPPFMRWAFAAMDMPGALESIATEAFYYVTPVEPSWSSEQATQWLRDMNYHKLRIISIHETYPGHYLHHLHNQRATSTARRVLGSYSFWEGFAHYCEEMVVDAGYRNDDPRTRVAQALEALVRDCRYLAAIGMHTGAMTVDEATRLFQESAFMEEFPARKEAERGTFDPGYLNYTLGKLMIKKLRADWQTKKGPAFSLGNFHDALLSLGGPPVPLVREALLGAETGTAL